MSQKVMPMSEDPSRSLEINAIWTFDTEFPTILINHAHIVLSSLQLNIHHVTDVLAHTEMTNCTAVASSYIILV